MVYLRSVTITVLVSMWMASICTAEPLRVGIVHFPPLYIIEEGQPPRGSIAEVVDNTLKLAGQEYQFIQYPPKRIFVSLGAGDIHMYTGIKDHETYHDRVIYSKMPIGSLELRIYSISEKTIPNTIVQLLRKKMGLIRGFSYGGWRKQLTTPANNAFIYNVKSHKSALMMLEQGRFEYLLDYMNPINEELKLNPVNNINYESLDKIDFYFILNKNLNNAEELMRLLERSYESLYDKP